MATEGAKKELSAKQRDELLGVLEERFDANAGRHRGVEWADVRKRLASSPAKLRALHEMERTGGEPDVLGRDGKSGEILFCDCSPETPEGRRSLCYDREAFDGRKGVIPQGNAVEMAAAIGIELLTEEQYFALQKLGEFDTKTSSWLQTPADVRKLGGALFGDRRFGRVFIYHNGAQSFYAARGFRGLLRV